MSIKRTLSLVLTLAMVFSLVTPGVTAYADGPEDSALLDGYTYVETVAPTCGADGYDRYTNEEGAEIHTNVVPATGEHTWGEGVVTDPTCVADGFTAYTCTVCGATKTEAGEAATGEHNYVEGFCSVCGAEEPVVPDEPVEDEPEVTYVAFVEDVGYESFAAAVEAAGEDKVITLAADVEYTFEEPGTLLVLAGKYNFTVNAVEGLVVTSTEDEETGVVTFVAAVAELNLEPITNLPLGGQTAETQGTNTPTISVAPDLPVGDVYILPDWASNYIFESLDEDVVSVGELSGKVMLTAVAVGTATVNAYTKTAGGEKGDLYGVAAVNVFQPDVSEDISGLTVLDSNDAEATANLLNETPAAIALKVVINGAVIQGVSKELDGQTTVRQAVAAMKTQSVVAWALSNTYPVTIQILGTPDTLTDAQALSATANPTVTPVTLKYDDRYAVSAEPAVIYTQSVSSTQVGTDTPDENVVVYNNGKLIAVGVGEAYVAFESSVLLVTVEPAELSLLLITGHSMSAGQNGNGSGSVVNEDGTAYSTRLNGISSTANVGIGYGSANRPSGIDAIMDCGSGVQGNDSAFAYEWHRLTGEKLWVVNTGVGGTSLNTWKKGGTQYNNAVALFKKVETITANEVAAGHYTLSHMAVLNHTTANGDQTWPVNDYITAFNSMWNGFKSDLAFTVGGETRTVENIGLVPIWTVTGGLVLNNGKQVNFMDACLKSEIYIACDVHKQWVTDAGIANYFSTHELGYSKVQSGNPPAVPTSIAALYAGDSTKVHYSQVGYNVQGIEAARSLANFLGISASYNAGVTLTLADGVTTVADGQTIDLASNESIVLVPVPNKGMSAPVTITTSELLSYDTKAGILSCADGATAGGVGTVSFTVAGTTQTVRVKITGNTYGANNYYWEFDDNLETSSGYADNTISYVSGEQLSFLHEGETSYLHTSETSTTNSGDLLQLENGFPIDPSTPWIVELGLRRSISGIGTGILLSQSRTSGNANDWTIWLNGDGSMAFTKNLSGASYRWYKIPYAEFSVNIPSNYDPNAYHVYTLVNNPGTGYIEYWLDGAYIGSFTTAENVGYGANKDNDSQREIDKPNQTFIAKYMGCENTSFTTWKLKVDLDYMHLTYGSTITLDPVIEQYEGVTSLVGLDGTVVTLPLLTTDTGVDFLGWATTQGGAVVYEPYASYTINGSTTLYAVWGQATQYYVVPYVAHCNIIPNGGSASPVAKGGSYSFTVEATDGYAIYPELFKVYANDSLLTADENGVYTISNIRATQTITVDGLITPENYARDFAQTITKVYNSDNTYSTLGVKDNYFAGWVDHPYSIGVEDDWFVITDAVLEYQSKVDFAINGIWSIRFAYQSDKTNGGTTIVFSDGDGVLNNQVGETSIWVLSNGELVMTQYGKYHGGASNQYYWYGPEEVYLPSDFDVTQPHTYELSRNALGEIKVTVDDTWSGVVNHYRPSGWGRSSGGDGTPTLDFSITHLSSGNTVVNKNEWAVNGGIKDIVFYPDMNPDPATVSFEESTAQEPIVTVVGTTVDLPVLQDTEELVFLGWSSEEGSSDLVDNPYVVTGDVRLYPVWTDHLYHVTVPAGAHYTLVDRNETSPEVEPGGTYSFSVKFDAGWQSGTTPFLVKANEVVIEPVTTPYRQLDGSYKDINTDVFTIEDINSDIEISVSEEEISADAYDALNNLLFQLDENGDPTAIALTVDSYNDGYDNEGDLGCFGRIEASGDSLVASNVRLKMAQDLVMKYDEAWAVQVALDTAVAKTFVLLSDKPAVHESTITVWVAKNGDMYLVEKKSGYFYWYMTKDPVEGFTAGEHTYRLEHSPDGVYSYWLDGEKVGDLDYFKISHSRGSQYGGDPQPIDDNTKPFNNKNFVVRYVGAKNNEGYGNWYLNATIGKVDLKPKTTFVSLYYNLDDPSERETISKDAELEDLVIGSTITLPALEKDGYRFEGYSLMADGDVAYHAEDTYTVEEEDPVLYAKWTRLYRVLASEDGHFTLTDRNGTSPVHDQPGGTYSFSVTFDAGYQSGATPFVVMANGVQIQPDTTPWKQLDGSYKDINTDIFTISDIQEDYIITVVEEEISQAAYDALATLLYKEDENGQQVAIPLTVDSYNDGYDREGDLGAFGRIAIATDGESLVASDVRLRMESVLSMNYDEAWAIQVTLKTEVARSFVLLSDKPGIHESKTSVWIAKNGDMYIIEKKPNGFHWYMTKDPVVGFAPGEHTYRLEHSPDGVYSYWLDGVKIGDLDYFKVSYGRASQYGGTPQPVEGSSDPYAVPFKDKNFAVQYVGAKNNEGYGNWYLNATIGKVTLKPQTTFLSLYYNLDDSDARETVSKLDNGDDLVIDSTITLPALESDADIFLGYSTTPDGAVMYEAGDQYTVKADGEALYGQWTACEARIGDDLYVTFGAALAAAHAAAEPVTITLVRDVQVASMFDVTKTMTIDLNGHKLKRTGDFSLTQITDGATLTINGTTEGSEVFGRINVGKANNDNGNVVLNGGTYSCVAGQTVLHVNGTCRDSDVTITNATITSPDDNGIQLNGAGTFIIAGSTISGKTAVYQKAGQLTISDSTLTSTAAIHTAYNYNNNGSNPTGDAIVVDTCAYPGGSPTTVLGPGTVIEVVENSGNVQVGYYEYNTAKEGYNPATIKAKTDTLSVPEGFAWVEVAEGEYQLSRLTAEIQFLGGSLRKRVKTGTTEVVDYVTDMRFGFKIFLPVGAQIDMTNSYFGWRMNNPLTPEDRGTKKVSFSKIDDADPLNPIANLVITKIPAAYYKANIYCYMHLEYTMPGQNENVVVESFGAGEDPYVRSVYQICQGLLAVPAWKDYAEALIAAIPAES